MAHFIAWYAKAKAQGVDVSQMMDLSLPTIATAGICGSETCKGNYSTIWASYNQFGETNPVGASNNCVDMAEFGRKTSLHPATYHPALTGQKYGMVCPHSTGQ